MGFEAKGAAGCIVCAWRATCNKKFSVSKAETFNCPDFTRDVSLGRHSAENKGNRTEPEK